VRRLSPILVATVLLAGCKSDAEKLVDLRTDLRTKLDELYSAYGGGALAAQAEGDAEEPERSDVARTAAARLVGELDRSYFEGFCLARGRGERPFSLSGKLDAFMKEAANEKACREAAKLEARIAQLESKVER
jgi:outer membrane murein-binding lipoprotein Lpp